jgi:hypothetical protein
LALLSINKLKRLKKGYSVLLFEFFTLLAFDRRPRPGKEAFPEASHIKHASIEERPQDLKGVFSMEA